MHPPEGWQGRETLGFLTFLGVGVGERNSTDATEWGLGGCLAVAHTTKQSGPSYCILGYLLKENENTCVYKKKKKSLY